MRSQMRPRSSTALHGLDEADFFVEVACKCILHQLVEAAALQGGEVGRFCFQFALAEERG